MRNHIAVKFIAVILCALALLGSVASGGSVLALMNAGLYDRTVEEVRDAEAKIWGKDLATSVSLYYSSTELGGCPEQLVRDHISNGDWYYYNLNWDKAGYALKDADGKIVDSGGALTAEDNAMFYTFPVSGKYLHLVSKTPKVQKQDYLPQSQAVEPRIYTDDKTYIYNAIPASGAEVYGVTFWGMDSQVLYNHGVTGQAQGVVMYNENGSVLYRSYGEQYVEQADDVSQLEFLGIDGELIYEAYSSMPVGTLEMDGSGAMIFTASLQPDQTAAALEETAAQTEAATQPPTETTSQETAATEASASETTAEEAPTETVADSEETVETEAPEAAAEEEPPEEVTGAESDQEVTDETAEAEGSEDPQVIAEISPIEAELSVIQAPTVPETTAATLPSEVLTDSTAPLLINGKTLDQYDISNYEYYDNASGTQMVAQCVYVPMPEMTMELYLAPGGLRDDGILSLLGVIRGFRSDLFLILGISLLCFAVFGVYLCCAAGRKPKSVEVQAGGLNRMPLDLYLVGAILAISGIVVVIAQGANLMLEQNLQVGCAIGAGAGFVVCLIFVGFWFAFVAQIKTPGGFWWRNSLCGRILRLLGRFGRWAVHGIFPIVGGLGGGIAKIATKTGRFLKQKTHEFLSLLPLTWQWLACGWGIFLLLLLSVAVHSIFFTLLFLVADILLILYGARSFGTLMDSARRMSRGDLNIKVDDKQMVGVFRDFAEDLNELAGVAVAAAQKQLKSERMKTELITNVSHDIKTPLTSIINYVDLLQRPHTQQEEAMYLEVLDRQSQRLKKLIEDLMEMSKANTGNMTVEITRLNAVESVNQALGEFADKLDRAQLIPVFRHTEEVVEMMADGRLVWRVLSNLLGNAVKYAMPGTRLYVDLLETDGKVILSLKNISREELNVEADELMERFVRGDDSRNTEGSGLGLNIAKSLMELQKGQLQLLVDGDLFKVTLIFPGV